MNISTTDELTRPKTQKISTGKLDSSFDFDQWAVQVREQMMASLRKRGVK